MGMCSGEKKKKDRHCVDGYRNEKCCEISQTCDKSEG